MGCSNYPPPRPEYVTTQQSPRAMKTTPVSCLHVDTTKYGNRFVPLALDDWSEEISRCR